MNTTFWESGVLSRYSTNFLARAILTILLMCMFAWPAFGQGVITGAQTGVVQESEQAEKDDLVISGVAYTIDPDVTRFTFRGDEISPTVIEEGMVVRFTIRNGVLRLVQLLGPDSLVRNIGVD